MLYKCTSYAYKIALGESPSNSPSGAFTYARQGYGFEAVSALIHELSQLPGIEVVAADVDPDNAASIGLLKKLSFAQIGADHDSLYFELSVAVALG